MSAHRRKVALARAGLWIALGAALLLQSRPAGAVSGDCHSDPVVLLSDLTTLDLSADIETTGSNVNSVVYTLHIPAGVRPLLIINTPSWTSGEIVHVYSDNQPRHYDTVTVVNTQQRGVPVTAHSALLLSTTVLLASASASGYDQQAIQVQMTR